MDQKLAAKIILALMVCMVLAGLFWSRVTLSLECMAVGLALVLTSSIWQVSALVKVGGYLVWLAGIVLAFTKISY
jgi:hypothetical protein